TPGMEPRPLPEGYAAGWADGNDLVLQLHLHPSGKPETEQSVIGLHFTDQKPRGRLNIVVINDEGLSIDPGAAKFAVDTAKTLPASIDLYGIFPHMHLIGRSVKVTAKLPNGSVEPLISIGDWDFNWQYYYRYATPLRLPAGTRIEAHWTFDNSADNPANPSHPPKRVTYGEQTTNEMAILIMDAIVQGRPARKPASTESGPGNASKP
ncbi:ascorbate-dependent monooxygenase, partial [Singulisphaera rosea]